MLYHLLKAYIALGLNFFFKKIKVVNREIIPEKGPILFVANHQNALIDALLIATHNRRKTYFLTRADAFKSKLGRLFLTYLKMLPVYRMRDGFGSINQNQEIFDECFEILNKGYCLTIFPEGNHDLKRRLRPLSKGFTRIALGALEKYKNLDLQIVPVGINYTEHQHFGGSVSLYFGKPIAVKEFNTRDFNSDSTQLKGKVSDELKTLIVHIEDVDNYDKYLTHLKSIHADLLNPLDTNLKLESINLTDKMRSVDMEKTGIAYSFFGNLVALNCLIPLFIWHQIKSKIKDPVMIGTFKFCIGIFLFPIFYLMQATLLTFLFSEWIGAFYLILSVISVPLLKYRSILKS